MTALQMLAAFVLIVGGAVGFTNAVEWLGQRLNLGEGAVGALLAAVGTALPESVIPIVALASGGGAEAEEIAIGAIIGAPFLLGTLAMLLVVGSAHVFKGRREQGIDVALEERATKRDLMWFLALMPIGLLLGISGAPDGVKYAGAAALVAGYAAYVARTVKGGGDAGDADELESLYFDTSKQDPPNTLQMTVQFVGAVEDVAKAAGVSPLVLALVLAPLATEMPEKANSVLWVRRGKDALALGNITGAMTFQATLPVALGLAFTHWELDRHAALAAAIGIAGGALARWALPRRHVGVLPVCAWGAMFSGFVAYAALSS